MSILTAAVASAYFDVSEARRAAMRREETAQAEARLVARLYAGDEAAQGERGARGASGALAALAEQSELKGRDKLGELKNTNPRVRPAAIRCAAPAARESPPPLRRAPAALCGPSVSPLPPHTSESPEPPLLS